LALDAVQGKEFFDEKLSSLCMTWLGDCVFSIRQAATGALPGPAPE
jgi:serine/threonine-protein phosphatase 2A regulatory subunit A